jgi:hypothetical protein
MQGTRRGLSQARDHLQRRERDWDDLWRWNGRGPMLVVLGVVLLMMGLRLKRFEESGT